MHGALTAHISLAQSDHGWLPSSAFHTLECHNDIFISLLGEYAHLCPCPKVFFSTAFNFRHCVCFLVNGALWKKTRQNTDLAKLEPLFLLESSGSILVCKVSIQRQFWYLVWNKPKDSWLTYTLTDYLKNLETTCRVWGGGVALPKASCHVSKPVTRLRFLPWPRHNIYE